MERADQLFRYTLYHNDAEYVISKTDPKGWDSAELGITRSPKYHGMNYTQILSLSFICGAGKEFIDNIYNTFGIDEEIRIKVEESCECVETIVSASYNEDYSDDYEIGVNSTDCKFDILFEGMIDLVNIQILDEETQVPLIEQGLNQKLNSRADTKIDLFSHYTIGGKSITDIADPYDLNLHSKAITSLGNYEFVDYMDELFLATSSWGLVVTQISVPIEKDGLYFQDGVSIFKNDSNSPIDVKFTIDSVGGIKFNRGSSAPSRNTSFGLKMGTDPITSGFIHKWVPDQSINYGAGYVFVDFTVSDTVIITVPAGQTIWLSVVVDSPDGEDWLVTSDFTKLTLLGTFVSTTSPSVCKAQYIYESLARISEAVFDTADPIRSSYYGRIGATPYAEVENGCNSFAAITSGYMIRQYPVSGNYGVFISLNEIFNSLDAIDNIGLGFEKWDSGYKLRIERKEFFYQNFEIIKLEHVPDIKISIAQDYSYNDFTIGFEKWQTTSANGLDEYCSKSQYTNGLKAIANPLEKLSPMIGSAYILEQIRRMPYQENVTTDTDYDNDNFVIALNRSIGYDGEPTDLDTAEKNENFAEIENVLSPETTYNVRYTNSKNMLRNIPSLSPIITKYTGREVKFTYGEGNKFIITQDTIQCPSYYNGQQLSGSQNIIWNQIDEKPLYVSEYIEFQFPISRQQYLKIKDAHENPDSPIRNGYITISNEKETFKGFIIDLKYKQKTGLSTFKLIRKYD